MSTDGGSRVDQYLVKGYAEVSIEIQERLNLKTERKLHESTNSSYRFIPSNRIVNVDAVRGTRVNYSDSSG